MRQKQKQETQRRAEEEQPDAQPEDVRNDKLTETTTDVLDEIECCLVENTVVADEEEVAKQELQQLLDDDASDDQLDRWAAKWSHLGVYWRERCTGGCGCGYVSCVRTGVGSDGEDWS